MKRLLILTAALLMAVPWGLSAQKKPMGEEVFDAWSRVYGVQLSNDGNIITYEINPALGDGSLYIRNMANGYRKEIERGGSATLFGNQKWLKYDIRPTYAESRKAVVDNVPRDRQPKPKRYVMNLQTGDTINITERENIMLLREAPMVVFKMRAPQKPQPADSTAAKADSLPPQRQMRQGQNQRGRNNDQMLVMVDLTRRDTVARIEDVDKYVVTRDGSKVIYTVRKDTVTTLNLWERGKSRQLEDFGRGVFGKLVLDAENQNQFAYTLAADTSVCKDYDLYRMGLDELRPHKVGDVPEGMAVASDGNDRISFSKKGKYLIYSITYPYEKPEKDTVPDNEKFQLDLWSYCDTILYPIQNVQRNYLTNTRSQMIYDIDGDYSRRLTHDWDPFTRTSIPAWVDDNDFTIVSNDARYRSVEAWDRSMPRDYYAYWIGEDRREPILENHLGMVTYSPNGYVYYYDARQQAWFFLDPKTMERRNLTGKLKVNFWNEENDMPAVPMQYGAAGWLAPEDGSTPEKFIVYDRYDMWLLDPTGRKSPKCLTDGRKNQRTYRFVETDKDTKYLNENSGRLLLSSFDNRTKDEGFYALELDGNGKVKGGPDRLVSGPYSYSFVTKAKEGDRVLWTRENYQTYPDVHTSSDLRFADDVQLTEANPQMAEYLWGSSQLVEWQDKDGNPMSGVLYLPEDYDPAKKYPTIVYYYERSTDELNKFNHAEPSWSIIMKPMYTSNGYVILDPDIKYEVGRPMECGLNAVTSGAQALIDRGIADPDRIGIQGQSWGGTQTYYFITQTDMFRCASAGAGETDMVAGYGFLRGDSGSPRSFQYEMGQSRMGSTPWDNLEGYIANSALYHLPNVTTPLLIRHCNNDEAVSFHQGMMMFNNMRRLGKKVWLLNYNGGGHNMRHWYMKRDFDKRMMQFFDHYLKDAAAPRWMVEGMNVRDRGKDMKLDLVD